MTQSDDSSLSTIHASLQALHAAVAELQATQLIDNANAEVTSLALDTNWITQCTASILLMQIGFAMVESGAVREQNSVATYAKNVLDLTTGALVSTAWGYQVAHGLRPLFDEFTSRMKLHFFLYMSFVATAATIVSGAMAERTSVMGYLVVSCFVSGVLFPVAIWWHSTGFLRELDPPFHDFAGSGLVHIIGGVAALIGCLVVGPRMHRWDPAFATEFVAHNVPSILTGALFLWVGWYGFNPGSTAAMSTLVDAERASNAVVVTTLSPSAGGTMYVLWCWVASRGKHVDIHGFANVLLGSLVAITAGADCVGIGHSAIVGVVAMGVYVLARWARTRLGIDDVVDAFPIHGACGVWGLLAVGLFHRSDGLLTTGRGALLRSQAIGAASLCGLALSLLPLLLCLRACGWLRASDDHEKKGLDEVFFGVRAYAKHSEVLQRQRRVEALLVDHGHAPAQLLEALVGLRGIIFRTLTPQAADGKLEGEVRDILQCLRYDDDEGGHKHLGFISHHKSDAGDAARIFRDTACRLLLERPREAATLAQAANDGNCSSAVLGFVRRMKKENSAKTLKQEETARSVVVQMQILSSETLASQSLSLVRPRPRLSHAKPLHANSAPSVRAGLKSCNGIEEGGERRAGQPGGAAGRLAGGVGSGSSEIMTPETSAIVQRLGRKVLIILDSLPSVPPYPRTPYPRTPVPPYPALLLTPLPTLIPPPAYAGALLP